MTFLREAFLTVLRLLRVVWELIEPLLALSSAEGRAGAAIIFLTAVLMVWRWLRKKSRPVAGAAKPGPLGPNPSLISVCEYLVTLINDNRSILARWAVQRAEADSLVQDLRDDVLRVYFFGHQKAGKSSLVNALVGELVSPVFPGKLTACLVRIRYGEVARLVERWENGAEKESSIGALKKKMVRWTESDARPREVIVELPRDILGNRKTELVDAPGTGSAWNDKHGRSLEDEAVGVALRSAAVVVVVYRYSSGEIESHDALLRQLGSSHIPTIAVCNLDPNWAAELAQNSRDIDRTIDRAEARLRELARATCYQVAVRGDAELLKLARRAGADTMDGLREALVKLLGDRKALVVKQAVRKGHALIEDLFGEVRLHLQRNQPLFEATELKRLEILGAITGVRAVLNEGYERGYGGTLAGALVGGGLGLWGAGAAAVALTAATGGLLLGFVAAGAAVGFIADQRGRWRFEKKVADAWNVLQGAITATELIGRGVAKKIATASSTAMESDRRVLLTEVETDLGESVQRIAGYEAYRKSKVLEAQLHELWSILHSFDLSVV